MLGALVWHRVLASAGTTHATTRFIPSVFAAVQLSPATRRTFTSSLVSRDNGYGDGRAYPGMSTGFPPSRPRSNHEPSPTIYVGNLPFSAEREAITDLFADFGNIMSIRMATFPSGESRGFAHVEFNDTAAAQKAMDAYDEGQLMLDGRPLRLDWAGPMVKPSLPPSPSLHVGNFDGDEHLLHQTLVDFKDSIQMIRIVRHPQTQRSLRYGFIDCNSTEDATNIMNQLNGKEISYGQRLTLSFARNRNEAPRFTSYGRGDGRTWNGEGRQGGDRFGRNQWRSPNYGQAEGDYRSNGRRERGGYSRGYDQGSSLGPDDGSYGDQDEGPYPEDDGGSYRGGNARQFRGQKGGS